MVSIEVVMPVVGGLEVGDTAQLQLTLRDANGQAVTDRSVDWTSEHDSVATVSAFGLLTGLGAGQTRVTAAVEGVSRILGITIIPPIPLSLTAGTTFTCALTAGRRAYCWGRNLSGELGTTSVDPVADSLSTIPVAVDGRRRFRMIAGGDHHACGITRYGEAYCWGSAELGQLGVGTLPGCRESVPGFMVYCSFSPMLVAGNVPFVHIDAGGNVTCGVSAPGAVYCWGRDQEGQLGAGIPRGEICGYTGHTALCETGPRGVPSLPRVTRTSVGFLHVCGLDEQGEVNCWGTNAYGQFGAGTKDSLLGPTAIPSWGPSAAFASMSTAGCALSGTGVISCAGDNSQGNLGVGHTGSSTSPQPVSGSITFLTLHGRTTNNRLGTVCGITTNFEALCWGNNRNGELGRTTTESCLFVPNNTRYPCGKTPAPVDGGHEFVDVAVGNRHACGRTTTLEVYCWGDNVVGQLGDGGRVNQPAPVRVALPST